MGTEENNPDRVFLPPTSRNPDELSQQANPAQRQPPPTALKPAAALQPQYRPPTTSGRHGVFLSYARSDGEAYANALRQRLNQDLPSLPVWQDRPEIEGGVGWWRQIETALERVEFLVSVMTPAALASEVTAREWRAARQRGVCVFPVQGPGFDFADPRLPRWMARAHFYALDTQWETFLAHLQRGCQTTRVPFMAPDLPLGFVQRPKQFEALRALLLEGEHKDPVAITTALTGAGGFGKTTLAAALCHDEEIIQAFDDGILWTTLGETPDLADALAKLHAGLTGERPAFKDAEDAATSLAERLEGKNCLVVIDDVWDPAHLEPFLRGGPCCARLITSRLLQVATDVQAQRLLVDEMSASEAVAMLTARLPGPPPNLAELCALARALGEWPLLLRLAASAMAELVELGSSVAEALATILEDLAEGGVTSWDRDSPSDRNAAVAQTLQLSLKRLASAEQVHYKKLAVFPEDEPIPLPVAAQLWGLDGSNSRRLSVKLATASLLEFNPAAGLIRLHDVLRTFLGQTLGQAALAQAHAGLIDSWGDPHQLPHPYAWRWIGYHLEAAGRQSQLDGLLLDCPWLQAKLNATGIAALEREFDHASATAALERLRRRLVNASHVLAAQPEQLPSQLLARWPTDPLSGPTDAAASRLRDQAIAQLRKAGAPRPLTASLFVSEALLRTLTGIEGTVHSLAVLTDGRLASGSADHTIKLWNPATGLLAATLEGHSSTVFAQAVLTDGRLASGSADHTIKLWNPATGLLTATLEGHSDWVTALAVLPDGRLASGSRDTTIKLWDTATGCCAATLEGHADYVNTLAVLPGGRLASGANDSTIKLWDLATGQLHATLEGHSSSVMALVKLPDGRLASGSRDKTIKLWNTATGRCAATLEGHSSSVNALAMFPLPDGLLASGSSDETVKIWEPATGKLVATLIEQSSLVFVLAIFPDGMLASGGWDFTIRLWDPAACQPSTPLKGHSRRVDALAVLPDRRLASGSYDNTIKLWDPACGQLTASLESYSFLVRTLAVLPDGRLASGAWDKNIKLWNLATGQLTATLEDHSSLRNNVLAVLPDGRLASGSDFPVIKLWDPATGQLSATLEGHINSVLSLAVLPDGRLASGSADKTIKLWDPVTGHLTANLEGHINSVSCLAVLPDGRLASGSDDKTIKLWDPLTGHLTATFIGHSSWVSALAVLPDGRFASGSGDNTIKFWDPTNAEPESSQPQFIADAAITALAFLPAPPTLVAGDASGRLHWLRLPGP
jgi:WD40 repeat protein